MDRLGQRFSFQPSSSDGDPLNPTVTKGPLYRFDVLAADEDYRWPGNYTTASHPDKDGLMSVGRLQNQWTNPNVPATVPAVSYRATIAWYVVGSGNGAVRGPIDTQFVHSDASVSRYDNVIMFDDRMAPLVVTGIDEYNAGRQAQVPPANHGGK